MLKSKEEEEAKKLEAKSKKGFEKVEKQRHNEGQRRGIN